MNGSLILMSTKSTRIRHNENAIILLCCALFGCSASEHELFENSRAIIAEGVGLACEVGELRPGEIVIETSDACLAGSLCLGIAEDTGELPELQMCSCRCDGPQDTGPFCACPESYACTHVIEDLTVDSGQMSGSYCLPQ